MLRSSQPCSPCRRRTQPGFSTVWRRPGISGALRAGPGPDPADATCDSFGASTVTTPFLTQEVKVPPAAMR
jgi:hypothetical protein